MAGAGHFDTDGNIDILWRYNASPGYTAIWLMDGKNLVSSSIPANSSDLNFQVGGLGDSLEDIDGDGLPDIWERIAACFLTTAKYAKYAEGSSLRISVRLSLALNFEAVLKGTQVNQTLDLPVGAENPSVALFLRDKEIGAPIFHLSFDDPIV